MSANCCRVVSTYICGHPTCPHIGLGGHLKICLYCLKCTKFCQLIPMQENNQSCCTMQMLYILGPKCTKFDFGWGTPELRRGAYSAPSGPLAVFKGLLLRGERGEEG